ncbi:MAG: UxaA family hydrolase [Deltaproteobacteria bacterium]|nr:UxaA family hydrolase [Deltaproteobacteria bacterium]
MKKRNAVRIHRADSVAVAARDIGPGEEVVTETGPVVQAVEPIPAGHKVALSDLRKGDAIIKCGETIGVASTDIRRGTWVHTHNVTGDKTDG